MSYITNTRRSSPTTIAAVVIVHVAIGYAFLSGLAMKVIREIPVITTVTNYRDTPPPPPPDAAEPQRRAVQADQRPTVPTETMVDLPPMPQPVPLPPPPQPLPRTELPPLPPAEATPSLQPSRVRAAAPRSGREGWVTSDDYPAAALRDRIEGTTVIRVTIGPDGRVGDCTVTQGSGNALLDQATCRTYARRARFTPALDDAGNAVAASREDKVTWRIPR